MEKTIKFIWALTILTACLMIVGQGYWLYNQYNYSVNEYMLQLHTKIKQLEKEEFECRYITKKLELPYLISCMIQMPDSNNVRGTTSYTAIFREASDTLEKSNLDSVIYKGTKSIHDQGKNLADTFKVNNISFERINEAASRYRTEMVTPFTVELFDSLLSANQLKVSDMQKAVVDTFLWESVYRSSSCFFSPEMHVTYPYNPLKKEVVQVSIKVPLNPLIRQMGWQLLGSVCLLLLLMFCLLYQVKVILKQRKIDELRKSFVNTMIHELKRPVQTLKMCIAFLKDKTMRHNEQEMDQIVQDAMFELDNLSAYLSKVRDMTRADYENTPLNIRTFDLKETIEKLIRLHNAPHQKSVVIETEYEMDSSLVTADPVHLANIVSNLIENAVKYSGRETRIHIVCTLHHHQLTLSIADNGIGIPLAEQNKVFDKFYRAHNLPDRSIPGIGLGLSYVKLLVEAHHGTIRLESSVGKGSMFILQIPQ